MGERRWLDPLLLVLLATAGAAAVTGLWQGWIDRPFVSDRDGLLHLALIQNQIESGTWLQAPRLGAPFGASFADFPLGGERVSWIGLWLLGRLTRDPVIAANLWILGSYPLVALAGWFGARKLGLSRPTAIAVALLFAFLPYHTVRDSVHLLRITYVGVPLAAWWILRGLDPRPWTRNERLGLVLAGVVLGCCDTQHAIFFTVLFGAASLMVALAGRDWRPLALSVALAAAAGGTLVANNLPYVHARVTQGPNEVAGRRVVNEQERYGLRIAQMVLPTSNHRIAPFAAIKARSRSETLARSEDGQSLGALGTAGLLVALFSALGAAVGLGRSRRPSAPAQEAEPDEAAPDADRLLRRLGVLCLVAMLAATGSGFAYLLSLGGLTSLRTWNRISLFIAYFALIAAGLIIDGVGRRLADRGWPTALRGGLLVALTGVGLLDMTTPARRPDHSRLRDTWNEDARFFATVERGLGEGAMVAQWPHQRFPEPPDLDDMRSYEHLRAYLHTRTLRWSYGGMAGRAQGDWSHSLERLPPSTRAAVLAAAGFDAIYIDRAGLEGGVRHTTGLERALIPLLGAPVYTGSEGRRALYDLRPLRAKLEAEGVAPLPPQDLAGLAPSVRLKWGRTFFEPEQRGGNTWRWSQQRGHLRLVLDRFASPQRVHLRARVTGRGAATGVLVVRGPDGEQRLPVGPEGADLALRLEVPDEGVDLWLHWEGDVPETTAADRRPVVFRLINPLVYAGERAVELDCWARAHDPSREACASVADPG